ncbi:glucosamine-6-phosphate deaminase [Devosia sp. 2618]|uniref:glucosamine-6-phosphate deaminase n=1 Tax=Devosia sp. 2618 TaxID=3156454 RepID=UPI003397B65A
MRINGLSHIHDGLLARSFPTRAEMAKIAATDIAEALRACLASQSCVRMIFAAAPSQQEVLDELVAAPDIDWNRVVAFHMDEYVGLAPDAPQRFANWLDQKLFNRVSFQTVHRIDPGSDPEAAAVEYAGMLGSSPIDIVCLGIGVNGHLAFNDPPVADFNDLVDVKLVELDDICRQQQVDDDCFERFEDVPLMAVTLTIPRLLRAKQLFCIVPGAAKRDAVRQTLEGAITVSCPASILRTHPNCTLYLDAESNPRS